MSLQKDLMEIKGKKVLIFGLARSGAGAANVLSTLGADVTVTDSKPADQLKGYAELLSPSVKMFLGGHPEGPDGTDMIIVSPGVPLTIDPLVKARKAGVPVIGELELAYQVIRQVMNHPHPCPPPSRGRGPAFLSGDTQLRVSTLPKKSPLPRREGTEGRGSEPARDTEFLAITGTNGKSTTTTLLDLMLRKAGFETLLGGNIGNALTEEIFQMLKGEDRDAGHSTLNTRHSTPDFVVAEVSSFQLESINEFRPKGSAILNITPDHLDRYRSLEEYAEAKARVFLNQAEGDFLVLNADDGGTMNLYDSKFKIQGSKFKRPRVYFFSRKKKVEGAYLGEDVIRFDLPGLPASFTLHPSSFRIKGIHNLENAMAASAMALLAGCSPEAVREALLEFQGLEHRMEFVRELDGVKYINDSKGTNVGAVLKSLEGFGEPIILIAGGRDKAGDFVHLRPFVKERVKTLVLIGEASEKIRKALGDLTKTVLAPAMKEAVSLARENAREGDVVLLSPACASFDMFRDFEDRGEQFKKIVGELR